MPRDPGPCLWQLPDPLLAAPGEDVVGVGADLDASTVLSAYRQGLFPMHLGGEENLLGWWSPDPRGVLPLDSLRMTRSLAKSCRRYDVTIDSAFEAVMRACGDERRPDRWITEEFVQTYTALHRLGWTHSVEVWSDGELVGGLYGIEVGGLFAGESMFHRQRDASKVALVALVDLLRAGGGPRLLDVQWCTDHLARLGAVEITREEYVRRLTVALALEPCLG